MEPSSSLSRTSSTGTHGQQRLESTPLVSQTSGPASPGCQQARGPNKLRGLLLQLCFLALLLGSGLLLFMNAQKTLWISQVLLQHQTNRSATAPAFMVGTT
jgi:uncharacterized protein HemX